VVPQLFDAQIAVLLNIPCLFAISELGGAHLPGADDAWNTTRTSSWLAIVDEQADHEQPVFLDVLGSLLSDAKFKKPLNDFSSALVAHTLYRSAQAAYDTVMVEERAFLTARPPPVCVWMPTP
jgi:hypothetical protein